MGAITVRGLDKTVVERLKARAKSAGRSMEEEARRILNDATAPSALLVGREAADHFRRRRQEIFGDRVFDEIADALREGREEDPTISPPDAGYP